MFPAAFKHITSDIPFVSSTNMPHLAASPRSSPPNHIHLHAFISTHPTSHPSSGLSSTNTSKHLISPTY
ncbi:hypothetical protein HBH53_199680 [Parastagonospora nodorum]|nr:hypothetical protein HBH53_199680 [Parastagonospora nodorum]KAH5351181.1 hypothetical protein HBI49_185450 [Parastagonospora nodorum]